MHFAGKWKHYVETKNSANDTKVSAAQTQFLTITCEDAENQDFSGKTPIGAKQHTYIHILQKKFQNESLRPVSQTIIKNAARCDNQIK